MIGEVGAYSSRKGLAMWRGQCHQPGVGVPPLRLAGQPARRRPLQKNVVVVLVVVVIVTFS